MSFFVLYLAIGAVFSIVGIALHAVAWNYSYAESAKEGAVLWIMGVFLWPLGVDMLLFHEGPGRK